VLKKLGLYRRPSKCSEWKKVIALLPTNEQELDVVNTFLQLVPEERRKLLSAPEIVSVDKTVVQQQMRQILSWFQSSCLEWKGVPHNVQQELSGAVKRHELDPVEWKKRMITAIESTVSRSEPDVNQKQQRKMVQDLEKRISKKKELASLLGKRLASNEQPAKRQRPPCNDAFVNASVAMLLWLYRDNAAAVKHLHAQENNPLLAYEEHFGTLVALQLMNVLKTKAHIEGILQKVADLQDDDIKFGEFESELTPLEGDSLYRRLRGIKNALEQHKSAESTEN